MSGRSGRAGEGAGGSHAGGLGRARLGPWPLEPGDWAAWSERLGSTLSSPHPRAGSPQRGVLAVPLLLLLFFPFL